MPELVAPVAGADAMRLAQDRIAGARHVLVALDFDGTLAPFHVDPSAVTMVAGACDVLDDVAARPGYSLALVSGRPAQELVRLAAPPVGTVIAAAHGAMRGAVGTGGLELEPLGLSAQEAQLIDRIDAALTAIAAEAPQVWVETKPLGRALHTRRASEADAAAATAAAVAGPASWLQVHALVGKSVVEIAVRDTTKAEGLTWARERAAASAGVDASEVAVVFAGDDTTDEHALAVLGPGDLGIKVGEGPTAALVRVRDEHELVAFLREVLA